MDAHYYCGNCHHPVDIDKGDQFCKKCGQKNQKNYIPIRHILRDFFSGIFNFDSKLWKTPLFLFRPGFLTHEFFKGRRKRYTPPPRMLLFSILIYFALINLNTSNQFNFNIDSDLLIPEAKKRNTELYNYIKNNRDSLRQNIQVHADSFAVEQLLNGIQNDIEKDVINDSLNINELRISYSDLENLSSKELIERYKITGFIEKISFRQFLKLRKSPKAFGKYFINHISWIIFISIPLMAFCLYFLYFRRKHYFIEHLVFLIHIVTFFFITGIPALLLNMSLKYQFPLIISPILWFIYTYWAMKKYYNQGYIKTAIKYTFFNAFYFLIGGILFVLLSVISVLMF